MKKDYYSILGVNKDADDKQIKRAYRRLARKYHPDVNPNDPKAAEKFKDISEAYHVLSDPQKRKQYDMYGDAAFTGDYQAYQTGGRGQRIDFDFKDFDLGDLGLGDILGDLFGSRTKQKSKQRANVPQRGEDIHYTIEIGFEDAFRGLPTTITLQREVACQTCKGSGYDQRAGTMACPVCGGSGKVKSGGFPLFSEGACRNCGGSGSVPRSTCPSCQGKGRMPKSETLKVHIPAGVDNGSKVRLAGKGNAGINGGPPGDLFLITKVRPHPYFERRGANLYCEVPVTFPEAALGAKIEVQTPEGTSLLKIPPGTQSGQTFRLSGKGMPHIKGNTRGDLFCKVKVHVPKFLDEDSKDLLRKFAQLNRDNPRHKTI